MPGLTESLMQFLDSPPVTADDFALAAGTVAADALAAFVEGWSSVENERRWCFRRHVGTALVTFNETIPAADIGTLEQARLFSSEGDLSLRRIGNRFKWRFIGKVGSPFAQNGAWAEPLPTPLRRTERTALLWGQRTVYGNGDVFWQEDRVGAAKLVYPGIGNGDQGRAEICYRAYTHAGRTVLVWMHDIREV